MADYTIGQLTAAGALTGAELIEVEQGGAGRKGTAQQIADYVADQLDIPDEETAESVKTKYESNDDTNAFTDAEKAKVENVPANTNSALAGKADTSHEHDDATTQASGFMSSDDKVKLEGVAENATANPNAIKSDPTGIPGAESIVNILKISAEDYASLQSASNPAVSDPTIAFLEVNSSSLPNSDVREVVLTAPGGKLTAGDEFEIAVPYGITLTKFAVFLRDAPSGSAATFDLLAAPSWGDVPATVLSSELAVADSANTNEVTTFATSSVAGGGILVVKVVSVDSGENAGRGSAVVTFTRAS